jgi:hypothetical protein
MPVSPDTRDLCQSVFAPDLVELAVTALETYAGRNLGTFRWYAGEPVDVSPESHRFAVEFINALIDKNVPEPPEPR